MAKSVIGWLQKQMAKIMKKKTGNQWTISPSQRYKNAIFLPPRHTAMEPLSYYYFIGPAVAAVLLLVINAVTILCSPSVKQLVVAGKVKRGELQRMPVMRYMKAEGKEEECSVCLSVFVDGQQVRQLPHCRHSFHVLCIDKWLASHCTCPVCRADVLRSGKHIAGAICVV